jgi:acylphosphatase
MKHVCITVTGKVQGVYFRATAKDEAVRLGITGFVKNLRDGSVYIETEGEDEKINDLIAWCHQGPAQANVRNVIVTTGVLQGFTRFEIVR